MPKNTEGFKPMQLIALQSIKEGPVSRVTVTTTIKGSAADDFEKMCRDSGLNRSQLLTQMVYHCLNRTDELKDFYKRLAILSN